MSEEPEVSPLRLKRPGAGGPPASSLPQAPATPPSDAPGSALPPPAPLAAAEPPLVPLPGMPPPSVGHETAGPERVRRRPSLAADSPAVPAHAPSPAGHPEAVPAPPPGPVEGQPAPSAPPVFKLKVGAKAPPPPPPSTTAPDPKAEALHALEHPPAEAPLLPLPGLGPVGTAAGVPLVPLPPVPSAGAGGAPSPAHASEGAGPPLFSKAPIHLRAEAPAEALDPAKLPPPLPARAARAAVGRDHARRDAMLFGLIFIVVVGAGAAAYFYFTKPEVAKETVAGARDKIAEAARLPGKALDEARQGLAEAREKEQARVDAVVAGKETPEARAVGGVAPGELQTKLREQNSAVPAPPSVDSGGAPAQTVTAYAGGKTGPVAPAVPEPVQPSARLLRYAENIRVSGVFQGSPARALIDGRLVREGDLAESTLGIRFAALDAQAKQLILEEPGGARVRVKY